MTEVGSMSMALWNSSIYVCIVLCLMAVSLISLSFLVHNPFLLFCNVFVPFIFSLRVSWHGFTHNLLTITRAKYHI